MNLGQELKNIAAGFAPAAPGMAALRRTPHWRAIERLVVDWSRRADVSLTDLHWPLRSLGALVTHTERASLNLPAEKPGTLLEWLVGLATCTPSEGTPLAHRLAALLPGNHPLLTAMVLAALDNELPEWLAGPLNSRVLTTRFQVSANNYSPWQVFKLLWPATNAASLLQRAFDQKMAVRQLLRADFGLTLPTPLVQQAEASLPKLASAVASLEHTERLVRHVLAPMVQGPTTQAWTNISGLLEAIDKSKKVHEAHWSPLQRWIEAQPGHREHLSTKAQSVLGRWRGQAEYGDFKAIMDVWRTEGLHEGKVPNQLARRPDFWSHYQSQVRGARLCLSMEMQRVLTRHNQAYSQQPSKQVNLTSENIVFDASVDHPYALLVLDRLAVRIPFSGQGDLIAIEGDGLMKLLDLSFPELIQTIRHIVNEGRFCLNGQYDLSKVWTQDHNFLWQVATTYRLVQSGVEPDPGVTEFIGLPGRYMRRKGLPVPEREKLEILLDILANKRAVAHDHPVVARALFEGKLHPDDARTTRARGRERHWHG